MTAWARHARARAALASWLALLLLSGACAAPAPGAASGPPGSTFLPLVRGRPGIYNLLPNSGFEAGTLAGWQPRGGASASADERHAGGWSARLDPAGELDALVDTEVGAAYKLTAWVKIARESGADWGGFRLALASDGWQPLAQTDWLLAGARGYGWFKIALSFSASTPQSRLQIGYFGGPGRAMVVYVDDVALFRKGQNQPPDVTATLGALPGGALPQAQSYAIAGDDPDGAIVRVLWDFGDGTRALAPRGQRRVALPGSYIASVWIADDDGAVVERRIAWAAGDGASPRLAIASPAADRTTVASATLTLAGSASAGASVRVSTDRGYAGAASGAGAWTAQVPLQPGWNRILAQASGPGGRIATAERLVRYLPSGPLEIANQAESAAVVERWEPIEATFALRNSAATDPQFPYDPAPPPGLGWVDGVSADGLFTPDNWQTIYRRPAFLNQRYQRALKGGEEWMYPQGAPIWTVRFAPPSAGAWRYRIEVREARGAARSPERGFTAASASTPGNHGPLSVARLDRRYFEYADGTPFLGAGHGIAFSPERFSYDASDLFDAIGAGNQQFFRWWLGGSIWGSAWQPWRSRTLPGAGYLPATGLTLDRAYGDGLASLRLDAANPIMFQGWDTGHAGLVPGRSYRARVRWRTEGIAGPAAPGQPYGVTLKLVGWPEPGQTGAIPALIAHVAGDTPWHVAEGSFVAVQDLLPNLALIFENATAGAAYVDEVDLYEELPGGGLGPQLLRGPRFNAHLAFDPRRGAGVDAIVADAAARGLALKLVIGEKDEYLLNHLAPDGLPDPLGGNFNRGEGTPTQRLHAYYWRHLFARLGAYRSVHSWELVNEAPPSPGEHFQLAAALASAAAADGNPHMASTSTWATLAADAWNAPASAPISYVDFHAYVRGTGWIEPKEELANDSARFFAEYDQAAAQAGFGKPVVWGEQGIDSAGATDLPDPLLAADQRGVWLHKLVWARCGPGGVYPLYWYTDQIFAQALHPIFGAWLRFMAGVPIANGRYQDIAAAASRPELRVLGQKDLQAGSAYLWIDNRQDTWRAVVDGRAIPAVSGTVAVALGPPGRRYSVTWYDTATGSAGATTALAADASGNLVLDIANLRADIAARITVIGGMQ